MWRWSHHGGKAAVVALQPPLSPPALSGSSWRDSGKPSSTEIVVIRRDQANLLPYASVGAGASK
jgi:hypothetical protein